MYSIDRMTSQEVHNTLPAINNKYALLKLFYKNTYSEYPLLAFLTIMNIIAPQQVLPVSNRRYK